MGEAEFGTVSLAELAAYKGPLKLGIERDLHWQARGPISAYIAAANHAGRIVQLPDTGALVAALAERGRGGEGEG